MAVGRSDRALVVVSSLAAVGDPKFRWLYRFCEGSGVLLAEMFLKRRYRTFKTLTAPGATRDAFLDTLRSLGASPAIGAIDVILMLHGLKRRLAFDGGGAVDTADLGADLAALGLGGKLRMLYSTCCYGDSHANNFVAGGFRAAVGAVGVNANAASELPTVLAMWGHGSTLKDAVAAGETPLTRIPQDKIARAMGFADADSDKTIRGDAAITIAADAAA